MKPKTSLLVSVSIIILILYSISLPLIAEEKSTNESFTELMRAKTLKCILGKGCSADWETGDPNLEIGKWSENEDDCILLFDSIDLKQGTARLIGSQGAGNVVVFATTNGITFIETTGFGNVNITTVFADYKKGTEDFIFVHSRHMKLIKKLLPSQYHGVCKIVIN